MRPFYHRLYKGLFLLLCGVQSALLFSRLAQAHDFKVGDLTIDHPYAIATPPGLKTGAAYFRAIKNTGAMADRLVSAKSPVAQKIELHRMNMDGNIMRMREVSVIDLPARSVTALRHDTGTGYHMMLVGLKQPLKDSESFKITLIFENAGEREITVNVQKTKTQALGHQH
jgi:copper(I)-binding protein